MVYLGSLISFLVCYVVYNSPEINYLLPQVEIGDLDFGHFWGLLLVWQLSIAAILALDDFTDFSHRVSWLESMRLGQNIHVLDWIIIVLSIVVIVLTYIQNRLFDTVLFVAIASALAGALSIVRRAREGAQYEPDFELN